MAEQRRYKRNRVPSKKALEGGSLSEELLDQNSKFFLGIIISS